MPFQITILDIIDIFLVAIIFFQVYRVIRGTVAFSIFITIFLIYVLWLLVKALNMELMSGLLGQIVGLGVLAVIIVFQQEVRRFLLVIGNRYITRRRFTFGQPITRPIRPEGLAPISWWLTNFKMWRAARWPSSKKL